MTTQLISESLSSVVSAPRASGEPGPPAEFSWRSQHFVVTEVIKTWKGVGSDRTHGSGEQYVHKHWFEVRVEDGQVMTIYFERQPRSRAQASKRWWLYQIIND